jgi:hypothetical protein
MTLLRQGFVRGIGAGKSYITPRPTSRNCPDHVSLTPISPKKEIETEKDSISLIILSETHLRNTATRIVSQNTLSTMGVIRRDPTLSSDAETGIIILLIFLAALALGIVNGILDSDAKKPNPIFPKRRWRRFLVGVLMIPPMMIPAAGLIALTPVWIAMFLRHLFRFCNQDIDHPGGSAAPAPSAARAARPARPATTTTPKRAAKTTANASRPVGGSQPALQSPKPIAKPSETMSPTPNTAETRETPGSSQAPTATTVPPPAYRP